MIDVITFAVAGRIRRFIDVYQMEKYLGSYLK